MRQSALYDKAACGKWRTTIKQRIRITSQAITINVTPSSNIDLATDLGFRSSVSYFSQGRSVVPLTQIIALVVAYEAGHCQRNERRQAVFTFQPVSL
jgi:hypothetical protein